MSYFFWYHKSIKTAEKPGQIMSRERFIISLDRVWKTLPVQGKPGQVATLACTARQRRRCARTALLAIESHKTLPRSVISLTHTVPTQLNGLCTHHGCHANECGTDCSILTDEVRNSACVHGSTRTYGLVEGDASGVFRHVHSPFARHCANLTSRCAVYGRSAWQE